MKRNIFLTALMAVAATVLMACNNSNDVFDEVKYRPSDSEQEETGNGGYLFAHMTNNDYGSLYYSISRDGKKWHTLNGSKVILQGYLGHPNICKGGDGRYYMIGVSRTPSDGNRYPILYVSDDLLAWGHKKLDRAIFDKIDSRYENERVYLGAPKIFYDEASKQFMITWHAFRKGLTGDALWESMRTFYVLTKDWESFTEPQRIFNFTGDDAEMATIDAIFYYDNGKYYCVVKDERWPSTAATGKTIRICSSNNLTGPYSNPSAPINRTAGESWEESKWQEAPIAVKKIDGSGWFIYTDRYAGKQDGEPYACYEASDLSQTKWTRIGNTEMPHLCQHGDVITISESEYKALLKAFPLAE